MKCRDGFLYNVQIMYLEAEVKVKKKTLNGECLPNNEKFKTNLD